MNRQSIETLYNNKMDKSDPIEGENPDIKRRRSQSKFNK